MLSDRTHGDDGVVAVLTALLVATVLLPVAALGLTSYVRTGVAEEMQRAADAGSLAAATSLLFVDVDGLDLRADGAKLIGGPGCSAAQVSLGGDWSPQRTAAPLSAAFAPAPVRCTPSFSLDDAYPDCIQHLVSNAQAVLDATVAAAARVTAALGAPGTTTVTDPLLGTVQTVAQPVSASATALAAAVNTVVMNRVSLAQRVFALVPAAQSDGIAVRLEYQVRGPLDGVLLQRGATPVTATSTSRRLFKPLLPTNEALERALSSTVAAADPALADKLATTLDGQGPLVTTTEKEVVRQLQVLLVTAADAVQTVGGGLEGAEDRIAQETTADQALRASIRSLHADIAAQVPLVPRATLDLMLSEPPALRLNPLNPTCQGAAQELVLALSRALQLNDDEKDLTSCLTGELLGLRDVRVPQTRACIAGLFRAQLRPNGKRLLPSVVSP